MAIYIKGVVMPKDCNSCPMRVNEVLDFCSVVAFSVEDYLDRPPFCPLTEVAEPHGRLIDEDALGEIIHRMWVNKKITNTKYNTFNEILDYVKTVIERSVK